MQLLRAGFTLVLPAGHKLSSTQGIAKLSRLRSSESEQFQLDISIFSPALPFWVVPCVDGNRDLLGSNLGPDVTNSRFLPHQSSHRLHNYVHVWSVESVNPDRIQRVLQGTNSHLSTSVTQLICNSDKISMDTWLYFWNYCNVVFNFILACWKDRRNTG